MICTRRDFTIGTGASLAAAALAPPALAAGSSRMLSNAAASPRARGLYAYLWSIYGQHVLTGQQESNFTPAGAFREIDYLEKLSGKLPAVVGYDYIEPRDQQGVNDRAASWYLEKNGIPTICWHWGAPDIGTGYENSKRDFDLPAALRKGTPQSAAMWRDMERIADLLDDMQSRDVPVLWRPLHEFSGTWFWWGKHGPDRFKALWSAMYDYFTRDRKLNNLIWVLGYAGQNITAEYYPGRSSVDIAGADIYVDDYGGLAPMFAQVKAIVGDTVPITLHENGPIPDPDLIRPDARWLYQTTWHTRWIMDEKANAPAQIRKAFTSQLYLSKDELPMLRQLRA
jgi:mannan endo-1,4-beta-mannosidase